jgi:hypothetical protein
MLWRVQSLAAGGTVPYGRSGKHNFEVIEGHSGGCRTGAFVPACLVSGGARHFMDAAIKRYSTPPYGTAENGHATQTIHFFWSSIAIALCGPDAHRSNMSAYIWKFNTYREFDGFANKNNSRTEYHGGDGVIGSPHWRTAGYVILFNAHKRNLAITGKPEYKSSIMKEYPMAFFGDQAFHNYVKRNWYLAESILGRSAPRSFTDTLKKIIGLSETENKGEYLFGILNKDVPIVVEGINSIPGLKNSSKVRLLQLVHGIVFESACTIDGAVQEDDELSARNLEKRESKKFKKDLASGKIKSKLECSVNIKPVSLVSRWLEKTGQQGSSYPALEVKGTVTFIDSSNKYLKEPVTFDFSTQAPSATSSKKEIKNLLAEKVKSLKIEMDAGEKGELRVEYNYSINGVPLSYTEKLLLPTAVTRAWVPNHCKVWVPGIVAEDYHSGQYCIRVLLTTGRLIACERRVLDAPIPGDYLLAGTPCHFVISPGSTWGHNLHEVKILNPKYRSAAALKTDISGSEFTGIPDALMDYDLEKGIDISTSGTQFEAEVIIDQTFNNPITIDSIFLSLTCSDVLKKRDFECDLEIWDAGKWEKETSIIPPKKFKKGSKGFNIHKKIVAVRSDRFRFKIKTAGIKDLKFDELRLHKALSSAEEKKLMPKYTW